MNKRNKISQILKLLSLLIVLSCGSQKPECHENIIFKATYFKHINVIDKKMNEDSLVTEKDFKTSVLFISRYCYVNFPSMANYANIYPYEEYKNDRLNWIKWYEENKCKNIQFK